jgi:predicted transposase YdaD
MSDRSPHDSLFRGVFSSTDNASGLLRGALPAKLAARINWASLRRIDGSFVDRKLADLRTDLLFGVRLGRREALLYVLLEHQSTPGPERIWRAASHAGRISCERWQRPRTVRLRLEW